MLFPVNFSGDAENGYVATFPDIPEAITQGETEEETLALALEALETALEFYFEDKRPVPLPAAPAPGQRAVELPAVVFVKVLLLNEMLAQGVRPAELARRMNSTPQVVNRLTNLRHHTRLDGIEAALRVLGRGLDMRLA
jgi:antitoxin HicB